MTASQPLPEFDGCQTVRRIATGPIADLYQAIQQPLGRQVLIKALSPSILPSSPFAATLEREARLLSALHHPAIPRVFDFVRRDARMWLVLEYIDGWPLAELLGKLGRFTPVSATAVALELARALEHAHRHDVVHRGLTPDTIFLTRAGQVKLTSFSVAVDERMPTAPELLDGGSASSAPAYMSPEQILGEPADPRSDIFSLGVLLFELLSGTRPFEGTDERSVAQRIRHDAPTPLGRLAPGVPSALERVVMRCLEKMSSDRFHSAAELVAALEGALDDLGGGPVRARALEALASAGLVDAPAGAGDEPPQSVAVERPRTSLAPALRGLVALSALIVAGGAAIQYFAARREGTSPARGAHEHLELTPASAGYLRVVVEPWAVVFVDGEKIDVTPFARAIPLRPGPHHLRFEHPAAPAERREVELVAGESVLVDVKMRVAVAAVDGGAAEPFELDARATGDAGDAAPSP
ncbi:MAG: serine/threonine-protein kinase [Sorangiineae bacterium]|nr:serine/threonine-protein kinase [Polyangiaceae bacterium]MEB2323506.1 serine/threonine-protein kinase [Sorangiineae bacterium]